MFLRSLNHFRGLAVLFVIASHCWMISGVQVDTFPERVLGNVIVGGTFLYVFISGYLFHHHFLPRFDYWRFLRGKARNVLLPYLVLSIAPIAWAVSHGDAMFDGRFLPQGTGLFEEWLVPVAKYLLTGRVVIAYWFIPFAMLNFACAPAHAWFSGRTFRVQALILGLAILAALLVQKPADDIGTIQDLVYSTPAYLLGILCSLHRERVFALLRGREFWLLAVVFLLAMLEAVQRAGTAFGNYHKGPWDGGAIDLMLPQKLVLSVFLLVHLDRWEHREIPGIDFLARVSFALFFLHPLVLWSASLLDLRWKHHHAWLVYPFAVAGVILASTLIAVSGKLVLKRWSRPIIGW